MKLKATECSRQPSSNQMHEAAESGETSGDIPGLADLQRQLEETADPRVPYEPPLRAVHSFTRGYAGRAPGIIAPRAHHLLSRPERRAFSQHDWNIDENENIRECFPLPLELTLWVAREYELKHHWNWRKKAPAQVTVDFLITRNRGGRHLAIDVKMAKDRKKPRVEEKLKIAKLTLELAGVPHEVWDENSVSTTFFDNYRFLRVHARCPEGAPVSEQALRAAGASLRRVLTDGRNTIRDAAFAAVADTNLSVPVLMRIAYFLIGTQRWRVDMQQPIGPDNGVIFQN